MIIPKQAQINSIRNRSCRLHEFQVDSPLATDRHPCEAIQSEKPLDIGRLWYYSIMCYVFCVIHYIREREHGHKDESTELRRKGSL